MPCSIPLVTCPLHTLTSQVRFTEAAGDFFFFFEQLAISRQCFQSYYAKCNIHYSDNGAHFQWRKKNDKDLSLGKRKCISQSRRCIETPPM